MKSGLLTLTAVCCAFAATVSQAQMTVNDLHSFSPSEGMSTPADGPGIIKASDGNYYGVTQDGGSAGGGTLYKMTISGSVSAPTVTYTTVHNFTGFPSDGWAPRGSLVSDGLGYIYGVTQVGGSNDTGVLYRYTLSTGAYTVLANFGEGSFTGTAPLGLAINVTYRSGRPYSVNIYGTTRHGGAGGAGFGTIFNVFYFARSPLIYNFTTIYTFFEVLRNPTTPPIYASNNKLYGVRGVDEKNIFEYDPNSNTLSDIPGQDYDLNGVTEITGAPTFTLVGTSSDAGTGSPGYIFRASKDASGNWGSSLQNVYTFNGGSLDGANPLGNLVWVPSTNGGTIYGTTSNGGATGQGTLFTLSVDFSINNYHYNGVAASFTGHPNQAVLPTTIGGSPCTLGTTNTGGTYGRGNVWEAY